MPKLKENTIFPNLEEEVAINAGIASDPDTYELTAAEFAELKPYKGGRPKAEVTKERITIRLSPDVLEAFKSTGKGWQTRIDGVLKEWLNEHASS
ncbi:MAG: BrnA antitoxin family protein [Methylococcales bacterium]|nr:BrnA antitoxin family protein [Methylococcales bacterium]